MSERAASEAEGALERWRAEALRALRGAPLDTLNGKTLDGLPLEPLYAERRAELSPTAAGLPRRLGPYLPAAEFDEARSCAAGASMVWLGTSSSIPRSSELVLIFETDAPTQLAAADSRIWPLLRGERELSAEIVDGLETGLGGGAWGVSLTGWDERGASAADQLAFGVAAWLRGARALEDRDHDLERIVQSARIGVAVGTEFFVEIAKLRALRAIFDRILDAAGIASRPSIWARTSRRVMAELDRPTNLIRATLAGAASLVGGADGVAVMPHEAGLAAERIATQLPLVLALESNLDTPLDPSRGSFFIEDLSDRIAAASWSTLQQIERGALSSVAVEARIDTDRQRRTQLIRTRRHPMLGVSRYAAPAVLDPVAPPRPELSELGEHRDAAGFEALRTSGRGLRGQAWVLEGCPEPRVDFAVELLNLICSEVAVVRDRGASTQAPLDSAVIVLCARDDDFASGLVELARSLRARNARALAVAGRPHEALASLTDQFVFLGADLASGLAALQQLARGHV